MENTKRKRGRPRKNAEEKITTIDDKQKKEKKDENIVLFLALSSDDSDDDNKFTTNDTETKNQTIKTIKTTEDDISDDIYSSDELSETKKMNMKKLIEEIKKRDMIIAGLHGNSENKYAKTKKPKVDYHCAIMAHDKTGKKFSPNCSNFDCWWCDHKFENLPVYIPNLYKNDTYYVFGNFCSFNCAGKYNIKMLKDFKCNTRHGLLYSLKVKITGDKSPIKFAPDRELLVSKGGKYTIDKFRDGFDIINTNLRINMPPMIPLVHVIVDSAANR